MNWWRLCGAGFVVCASAAVAPGSYTVVEYHPGVTSTQSSIEGTSGGQHVGSATFESGASTPSGAVLWNGVPDALTSLHPGSDFRGSRAFAVAGNRQGGSVNITSAGDSERAALWSGTAASFVNLHPTSGTISSRVTGVSTTQQVGWGTVSADLTRYQALLWGGTAESVIDLTPAGVASAQAFGIDGGEQVGVGSNQALLWKGSADNYVNLHPSGFSRSAALAISGAYQVGHAIGADGKQHAMLWNGTAESAIDLHPGSGYENTVALAVAGGLQAGVGYDTVAIHRALVWSGTGESVIDLHKLLPTNYHWSRATGVDADGNVVGLAADGTGRTHAVLWAVPEPGSALVLVAAGAGILTRRRRRTP